MTRPFLSVGSHVGISPMTMEDQSSFRQWLSQDARLRMLINNHHIPTMQDQLHWFERSSQPDRCMFSIFLTDGTLIGNGGFVDIDHSTHAATFRITIGHPSSLGKGYGTEAARLILRHGFDILRFITVRLEVLSSNVRAIKSYEKLGFLRGDHDPSSPDIITMMIDRHTFVSSLPES